VPPARLSSDACSDLPVLVPLPTGALAKGVLFVDLELHAAAAR
jgi:hypothetical protein